MTLRWLIRGLAFVVVSLTVCLAVVTTAGRIGVALLPSFEADLNRLLLDRDVALHGVTGRWRYLNPVVEIDTLTFTGGRATRVGAELDLLESLRHLAPVVRVARADSLELALVHNADGRWTLGTRAAAPAAELRIDDWLREGDAFALPDVRITLLDQLADTAVVLGEYAIAANIVNTHSQHRGRVASGEAGRTCAGCELVVEWELTETLLGSVTSGDVAVEAGELVVPPLLGLALGTGAFRVDSLNARWRVTEGAGSGRVKLSARDLDLPKGRLDGLRLDAAVRSRDGDVTWGRLDAFDLVAGDDAFSLQGTTFVADVEKKRVDIVAPTIDIAALSRQIRAAGSAVEPLVRWVDTLDPRGRIEALTARVDVAARTVSAVARLEDGAMEHYKGIPLMRDGRARVLAFEHGVAVDMVEGPATVGLLDLFGETSLLDRLVGRVFMWMEPGYLGVRSSGIEASLGESRIAGSFAVSRPEDAWEQRIMANVGLRNMDAAVAKKYVPTKLPEGVVRWLDQGIVAGHVDDLTLAYHGHTRNIEALPVRRIEMRVAIRDGQVRYHADWPVASGLHGAVNVTFDETRGEIDAGTIEGFELDAGTLVVPRGADFVRVTGSGKGDGQNAIDFVHHSPLAQLIPQVHPTWTAQGGVHFAATLTVPIKAGGTPLAVDLEAALAGVTLNVNDRGLTVGELAGNVHYTHPYIATASNVHGTLFGRTAKFGADTRDGSVGLTFAGDGAVEDVAAWLKVDPVVFAGELGFAGRLSFFPGLQKSPELSVDTDLVGVEVRMPAELGKVAADARDTHLRVRFDEKEMSFAIDSPPAAGWLHVANGKVVRGAFGVGVPPGRETRARSGVLLAGRLSELNVGEWLGGPRLSSSARLPPFVVQDFLIDRVRVRKLTFDDVRVDANGGANGFGVSVKGPTLSGSYLESNGDIAKLLVERLELPAGEEGGDPLADFDQRTVPDLDADISGVTAGGVDRGKWQLELRQTPEGLAFTNLVGDLNGLHVSSEQGGLWTHDARTRFAGQIDATDISKVLVAYGYAPSVEARKVKLNADVSWPGSPLNFGLKHLSGKLEFNAKDGRFVDVDGAGGTRIFSLLNFSAIAKRMTLDFSDVFGKGISFDEVSAKTDLADGVLRFSEPLDVAGTGSNFRVSGTVDLEDGRLDNEMIVTLPVSASLPWYAAYLGFFASPLAAGAVIVGERIFRNQIAQFSSAKYRIEGTLDDPKVDFVRVFTTTMDEAGADSPQTDVKSDDTKKGA